MEMHCVMLQTKIQMLEKLNKKDRCSYQIVAFVARKDRLL